jgi:endonuclease YncB( thermonuclease family)
VPSGDRDPWSAFPDADGSWADFPDAEPVKPVAKGSAPRMGIRSLDGAQAVDGDTLRAGDSRVRVWGIDAPEIGQHGWDRSGRPVPIGLQSRDWLSGEIANAGRSVLGRVQGSSYGRLVGPVTLGDADAGLASVRSGNALAAPSYVRIDPGYRFKLMEAERLARLNGVGPMNDTMAQAPADYRASPGGVPDRETIAQFWDTPTPWAGLRPEVEQRFKAIAYDPKVPLETVVAYARENGALVDLASLKASRDYYLKHNKAGGINYTPMPEVRQELGDGATGAGVRGFGEGFVAGGLGELGAVVDTFGGTDGRESVWNSDRRLADIWANNEWQNESILRGDDYAHPVASTIGEVGGAITSGFVIPYGAGARTVPQLAKVGGVYGGIEGFLGTDGSVPERLQAGVIGVPIGAAVNAVGGKALQAAAPVVARGVNALRGRFRGNVPGRAAETVGEAGLDHDAVRAAAAAGRADDPWTEFPDAPGGSEAQEVARNLTPNTAPTAQSIGMEGAPSESIYASLPVGAQRPRGLLDPATDAERIGAAERVQPGDVLPLPSNAVDGVEDAAAAQAGRFGVAKAPNEREALSRGTVRAWNGAEVPKVGPTDLVGWLRLRGGLQDQGGELSHMGLRNAARRGLEHVGQEARFGPLVNPDGDNLDDAAMAAWEAGYFPELTERPSVNEFLDALRDTYNGNTGRRFHPDDWDELDRFEATRGERYDLEQRQHEVGGPIWQDRSNPADEPAPFPPVEAYEEWPSDAIKRVGNIDVTKLDSPQDIRRALKTSYGAAGGFDAATRGRVTQAETERLASELGMTPEALLARRKGQAFNAEEALAARQILAKSGNELVNAARRVKALGDDPGSEALAEFRQKWMRHVAIQEQVSGMTAEAGRALQQFRQVADSREVRGDVLSSIVIGGGGSKRLQDAAETLLDAIESGPGVFNTVAEKAVKPRWQDKVAEWYVNALLGWPQTHVVNVTSNTLTSLAQIPEFATGALVGAARQAFSREAVDRVTASEVGARAFGLLQGAKEGARLFAQALRTGEASDFASKVEGQQFKAIGGKLGEAVRVPTRFLTAEDELFKGIARRMELNGQAVRIVRKEGLKGAEARRRIAELVADPTDEMFQQALDYGRYLTFQQKLGPFAQKVSSAASENLPLKFLLPFVRTPTNLMKFATERSPAAPLLSEWRKDWKAGGERRDMAVAKMLVGTGFGLAMYQAALGGMITGSAPSDSRKAKLLYADGWKPYSIKIDGTYYSYKRLDPFSTTIGVAADMATLPEGMTEKQREDKATLLIASIMGNLASKTWLSGASSFIEAITEPERYAGDFKNRLVASFLIPNVIGGTSRALDPVARKPETFSEEVRSRLPGLRDDLLPRRDVWGGEIRNQGGLGPDAFSPVWISEALNDPVNHELMQLDYAPGTPGKKIGDRELTPEEYDRYQELAGKASHAALGHLVASPAWKAMDDTTKVKAAKKTVAAARKGARGQLFNGGQSADDWDEFEDAGPNEGAGDAWDAFPDAPSRDVVADLTKAIPGIHFTSGFRTPEYNASLRARGYNPADDSEHLDGSALDMLPPPGKSLPWLRSAVRKYDPDARLLVHDGHLHAGFDGFYSAPKLGGMAGR